jgi:hypothetical protein
MRTNDAHRPRASTTRTDLDGWFRRSGGMMGRFVGTNTARVLRADLGPTF